ncbi:hypothetical protein [Streptomyces sp. NPDC001502]|uniref:hypothetical protein n=1 Tax=Streptomyces sp. NPDC001502 TaxID=3364578 RepID=UPI0036937E14
MLGIAAGGTITSVVHRRSIDGSLTGLPDPVREPARVSAELARHVAAATHDARLAAAADTAFPHAMHLAALWTGGFALIGAVVLAVGLRPDRSAAHEREHERERAGEEKRPAHVPRSTPS